METKILWTVITVLLDLIAGSLIWVCSNLTIPPIATVITTTICGIAGCATYNIIKTWISTIVKQHKAKRNGKNRST